MKIISGVNVKFSEPDVMQFSAPLGNKNPGEWELHGLQT